MTSCNVEFMSGPNHDGYGARIECPPGKGFASSCLRSYRPKIPSAILNCVSLIFKLYYNDIFVNSSSR